MHSGMTIVCVTGLPGAGKSTVAGLLSEHLTLRGWQASVLNTDTVHSGLFVEEALTDPEFRQRDYTPEELRLTYNALNLLSTQQLQPPGRRRALICDGSFRTHAQRIQLELGAQRHGAQFLGIYVQATTATTRAEQRANAGGHLGLLTKGSYEVPVPGDFQVLDNDKSLEQLTNNIEALCAQIE